MNKTRFITIIVKAFQEMQTRKETSAFVKKFEFTEPKTLMLHNRCFQANFVRISLLREKNKRFINLIYREGQRILLEVNFPDEQAIAWEYLQKNEIMPTAQEFLDARSLLNSISCEAVEHMIHGDSK